MDPKVKFESIQRKAITKNALKEQVKRLENEIQQIEIDEARQLDQFGDRKIMQSLK